MFTSGAIRKPQDLRAMYLHPGQLVAAAHATSITTILGSCVAVCLWDSENGVGGMNHFLLPHFAGHGVASPKFGTVAMGQLIEKLEHTGAKRASMRARIFGGASVLEALRGVSGSLGRSNVEVARKALIDAQIPIVSTDVEGDRGRKIVFRTDDGSAVVRLLSGERHAIA